MKASKTAESCPEYCEGQLSTIIHTFMRLYTVTHSSDSLVECHLPSTEVKEMVEEVMEGRIG